MVNGRAEMGVRGSICARVFMEGAGGPGGVRLPWAKMVCGRRAAAKSSVLGNIRCQFITLTLAGGKLEKEKEGRSSVTGPSSRCGYARILAVDIAVRDFPRAITPLTCALGSRDRPAP